MWYSAATLIVTLATSYSTVIVTLFSRTHVQALELSKSLNPVLDLVLITFNTHMTSSQSYLVKIADKLEAATIVKLLANQ